MLLRSLIAVFFCMLFTQWTDAFGQSRTSGNCSPAFAQAPVSGNVTINCDNGRQDLHAIRDTLDKMAKQKGFDRSQIARLIRAINDVLALRPQINRIDQDSEEAAANTRKILTKLQVLAGVHAAPDDVITEIEDWKREHRPSLNDKLAQTLALFNRNGSDALQTAANGTFLMALVKPSSPHFVSAKGAPKIYAFSVLDEFESAAPNGASCDLGWPGRLVGVTGIPFVNGDTVGTDMSVIPPDDPIMSRICRGLVQRASNLLFTNTKDGAQFDRISVYEALMSGKTGRLIIMLIPGEQKGISLDAAMARGYWASAFLADYEGQAFGPNSAQTDLQKLAGTKALAAGHDFHLAMPTHQLFISGTNFDKPYPAAAVLEYGDRLSAMDAAWLQYLDHSSVVIGGRKIRLSTNGKFSTILPNYSEADLDTPEFWKGATNFKDYMMQLTCIGARFAVSEGYARSLDLPAYEQCPLWQISTDSQ